MHNYVGSRFFPSEVFDPAEIKQNFEGRTIFLMLADPTIN